jgi:hypothetical protein
MIDVHIVRWKGGANVAKLKAKLKDEPVNVYFVDGIRGNAAISRALGFSLGNARWASFIDDDDDFEQGYFSTVLQVYEEHPDAQFVACGETVVSPGHHPVWRGFKYTSLGRIAHHGLVFDRRVFSDIPERFAEVADRDFKRGEVPPTCVSLLYANVVAKADVGAYLDFPFYIWNRADPARKTMSVLRPSGTVAPQLPAVELKPLSLYLYGEDNTVYKHELNSYSPDLLKNNRARHRMALDSGVRHALF